MTPTERPVNKLRILHPAARELSFAHQISWAGLCSRMRACHELVPGPNWPQMDEKAKQGEKLVSGDRPLQGCEGLIRRLHEQAQAVRWRLSVEQFAFALERAVRKRISSYGVTSRQR